MIQDFKRGMLSFLLLYILIGLIYMLTVGITVLYLLLAIFATMFCAFLYFKKVKPSQREGLMLGLFYIVAGFVLDLVFIGVTLAISPEAVKEFITLYTSWITWLGIVLMVASAWFTGRIME